MIRPLSAVYEAPVTTPAIAVVDCCGANISSVVYALRRLGVDAHLTSDKAEVAAAGRVILPGVGAFDRCMAALHEHDLVATVKSLTVPVLGICVGQQLMFDGSEEGALPGLGLMPGTVRRVPGGPVPGGPSMTVPHMGWNRLAPAAGAPTDPLTEAATGQWFYFTHSYYVPVSDTTTAITHYGVEIAAICHRDNFWGVQCHPERSAAPGSALLETFLAIP